MSLKKLTPKLAFEGQPEWVKSAAVDKDGLACRYGFFKAALHISPLHRWGVKIPLENKWEEIGGNFDIEAWECSAVDRDFNEFPVLDNKTKSTNAKCTVEKNIEKMITHANKDKQKGHWDTIEVETDDLTKHCSPLTRISEGLTSADNSDEIHAFACTPEMQGDAVNHPVHYTSDPSGIECIEITRHRNFNIGNAMKYLWRNGLKDSDAQVQDLKKAVWYIEDEIKRLETNSCFARKAVDGSKYV